MATTVHVLGTGTPTPTDESYGTAFALDTGDDLVMIDCGPAATWKLAKAGFSPAQVSTLFLTHHHFDHNVDYPCFLLTRWDQSIDGSALRVFGPPPTSEFTDKLIGPDGAFQPDYHARIHWISSQYAYKNRGGTLPRTPPRVETTDIDAGFTFDGGSWTVTSAYAEHAQPYLECLAYRFSTQDGDVVFSGDTGYCDSVVSLARGADVLLCMAWETDAHMAVSKESQGACGSGGAGRIAADAGVRKLVLVHTGPRISRPENRKLAVDEAREHFDGEIVFADEVSSFSLSRHTGTGW